MIHILVYRTFFAELNYFELKGQKSLQKPIICSFIVLNVKAHSSLRTCFPCNKVFSTVHSLKRHTCTVGEMINIDL